MRKNVSKPGRKGSADPGGQTSKSTTLMGTKRVLDTDERAGSPSETHLRQPDERDQSADEHESAPRKVMRQAHDDIQSGQQDTDARNRVAEILPDVPKTPQNFDQSDAGEQEPLVKSGPRTAPSRATK